MKSNLLKKSRYVYAYNNVNGGITFFNAKNLNLLDGDQNDLDILNSYSEGRIMQNDQASVVFQKKGMLVDVECDEETELIQKKQIRYNKAKEYRSNRVGYMRISLTEHCNMACKYCFVDRIHENKSNMSEELFVKIMGWFIDQNRDKSPLVQYFGGEPLLRMDLIRIGNEMLKQAKSQGILRDYVQEVVTNGTLLDDEIVTFMFTNNINISVSIDGFKEIHDKNRIFQDGTGSFNKVTEGLKRYEAVGGRVSLFITPTNDNIEHFPEIISYFVEELHAKDISVNTPQPYKFGWEVEGVKVAKAIQDTLEYCHEKNVRYNIPGNNILYLIDNKIPQAYSCMNLTYGKKENAWGIYVSSKGRVSCCVVECHEQCSTDFDKFVVNDEFIDWHFKASYLKECLNCPATNVCGGPCSIESLLTEGKRNLSKCQFMNSMLKWVMENDQ